MDKTKTVMGKRLLRTWMLRPSTDPEFINDRLDSIEFFLNNSELYTQVQSLLRHMSCNINTLMTKLKRRMAASDWQTLLKFTFNAIKLRTAVEGHGKSGEADAPIILQKVCDLFRVNELRDLGSCINDIVDFDESINEGRVVVKYEVDEELDEMKHTFANLDNFLSKVALEMAADIPQELASLMKIIYFPQLGFLVTTELQQQSNNSSADSSTTASIQTNMMQQYGMRFQFQTESAVYFKCDRVVELDESIGDIHGKIVDREIEILQKLQELALHFEPLLRDVSEVCANFDCLFSLTELAKCNGYTRPVISDDNCVQIECGYHPLLALSSNTVVANDITIGNTNSDSANKPIILLTGPNCSGKSVYLKQTALICYMAQIGSFVPAKSAILSPVDQILVRMQTQESICKVMLIIE